MSLRSGRWVLTAVALVLASSVVAPTSASAASPSLSADTKLYYCVSSSTLCTTSINSKVYKNNSALTMICWQDGRSAAGSVRWFYVELGSPYARYQEGFVPANRVKNQVGVKSCTDKDASKRIDGVIAGQWALARNGKTKPTDSENKRLAAVWGVGANHMLGDWSGDCIGFTVLAWDAAGGPTLPGGNAIDVYNYYKSKGRVNSGTRAPRGALVFWSLSKYGHVEVSLGNGKSIGTQGLDGNYKPITIESISSTNYLGWVTP